MPLVAHGSKVLAVLGVEISDTVKIDESTENIVKVEYYDTN
jgi:hypothetical protein